MKRLTIKKLIVISQSDNRSLEVPFSPGLNIIYGGNKTGKSSIIKSIFTAFGCECKNKEKDWKKLISNYVLIFQYGLDEYYISREDKKFQIFNLSNNKYTCIIETELFHEYSNKLMEVLEVKMPCISKDGKSFNITPPLLFRFQYIDQDDGWNKIADSFSNVFYIKDWKKNTNKYVSGYLTDTYFELMTQVAQSRLVIDEHKKRFFHNQQFMDQLKTRIPEISNADLKDPRTAENELQELVTLLDSKRQHKVSVCQLIGEIENNLFIVKNKHNSINKSFLEIEGDVNFAMSLDNEIICPTCGNKYCNDLNNQMMLSVDLLTTESLAKDLSQQILEHGAELAVQKDIVKELDSELLNLATKIEESKILLSYHSYYRAEGKQEFYNSCLSELSDIQSIIDDQNIIVLSFERKIKELKSAKRSREIKEEITTFCRIMADKINISKTFIKLNDFVQVVNKTGSELPRIIYMYQTALYLYNLKKGDNPFNFLVIDTPNQQGQDDRNLSDVFKSFSELLSNDGQVIIGTERLTGFEDKA